MPSSGFLATRSCVGLDEGVERAAFDVVAVDAVEGRAAAGVFLEQGEEPLHGALLARLLGGGRIGGAARAGCRRVAGSPAGEFCRATLPEARSRTKSEHAADEDARDRSQVVGHDLGLTRRLSVRAPDRQPGLRPLSKRMRPKAVVGTELFSLRSCTAVRLFCLTDVRVPGSFF